MLSEKQKQKLDTYFGFAMKKKAVYVGLKMEEMLSRKRLEFLLILPSCTDKKAEELSHYQTINPNLVIFRYTGYGYDVKSILGYDLLNAVGIKDVHLAKAIKGLLEEDMKQEV